MPIPTREDAMMPVLKALKSGQTIHRRALADMMAVHFGLSDEERATMLPSNVAARSKGRDAEGYAQRIGSRIVLIDGRRLTALMCDYDVGVNRRRSYVAKSIDGDDFEEV